MKKSIIILSIAVLIFASSTVYYYREYQQQQILCLEYADIIEQYASMDQKMTNAIQLFVEKNQQNQISNSIDALINAVNDQTLRQEMNDLQRQTEKDLKQFSH